MNFLLEHLPQLSAGLGAIIVIFLTAYATKYVERIFVKRPAFSLRSPVFRSDLRLIVEPANTGAQHRRALGVSIRGLNLPNAGKLELDSQSHRWVIELSKFDDFRAILKEGEDYSFQFFFDVDRPSEPVLIRYMGAQTLAKPAIGNQQDDILVTSAEQLVSKLQSNLKMRTGFSECILTRAFPRKSMNTRWSNVHDGKELAISNIANFELEGDARILVEPRYAWVINFRHCHSIAIRGLTFGHTEEGYCQGGVLRFESCSNIILERCDLFGCGTYGLEFTDCEQVEIVDATIRNCAYGIANLKNVSALTFRGCNFRENKCFDAFNLQGNIQAMIKNSTFYRNKVHDAFFTFNNIGEDSFYVDDCKFEENVYPALANDTCYLTMNNNKFANDVVGKIGWDPFAQL